MSNRAEALQREIAASVSLNEDKRPDKATGSRLRLALDSNADLRWFWNEAPGQLGIKGMNPDGGGGGKDSEEKLEAVEHRLEAAERYNQIKLLLDRIGDTQSRVLQRYHQEVMWAGLNSFGVLAGIALTTTAAKRSFRESSGVPRISHTDFVAWLRALSARTMPGFNIADDDREIRQAILTEAEIRLSKACVAYETAKVMRKRERAAESKAHNALIIRESRAHHERRAAGIPYPSDDIL